ncbi:hypothetical protein RGQ15_02140 [Paracoccus sp. MBLB3053]|uniref:TolA protein n=1 Tax=Paracoccus aurantius TaxID=3073814 RepID=A0ABU2HP22_9RHOB|nr:hypothetical protein [Paracoccus sp. MBLB3053]MDS9466374.1 hypothetical protein [Paracoccus sp. MBLB3053]
MIDQTQSAALRLLDDKALGALLRELRAKKSQVSDAAVQKELAKAIRRGNTEKRTRLVASVKAEPVPEAENVDGETKKQKRAAKAEAKLLKQAEKAEKKRVKQAEKEEKKAEKSRQRAEAKVQKKAAKTGKTRAEPAETD